MKESICKKSCSETYSDLICDLRDNFKEIQIKVLEITQQQKIDIKQISDLQRYVEMQTNIAKAIYLLGGERV